MAADDTARVDREQDRRDRQSRPFTHLRLNVAIRMWSLCISMLAQDPNLSRLLKRTAPTSSRPYAGFSAGTIWRSCHRAVKRPLLMRDRPCLREGLLLYRFLTLAGHDPTLYFGIDRNSVDKTRVRAHCWVVVGDRVFNPPETSMIEILKHQNACSKPATTRVALK